MSSVINSSILEQDIESCYLNKKCYPHCLIQLSNKEYNDLKDNSIHVTNVNGSNRKNFQYDNIDHIGMNLNIKKTSTLTERRIYCTLWI